MQSSHPGRYAAIFVVCAAVALSGCSVFKKTKPTLAYEERPVDLLFSVGAENLDRHQWNDAVNYFREVERQHPYSEWSRRAILMTAYAHYESNDYEEAIADADRFIALYPGNASAAYAYYLKAICYFEQITDVGRDQAFTQNAQVALTDVIKRYPNTEYAEDARLKRDMVMDQLAGKEMTIGRFYLRAGDTIAAMGRFRTVVDRYQTTSHAPEALYRLVEANLNLGLLHEATMDGAVLGYNYPGDVWYHDAYRLLTSKGLHPSLPASDHESRLPRLLPWGKHKETTVAPPAVSVGDDGQTAQAAAPAPTDQPPPKKKQKKGDFLHDVLGL